MTKPDISCPSATECRSDQEYERKGGFCAGGRGIEACAVDRLTCCGWRGGSGQGGDIDREMELFSSSVLSVLHLRLRQDVRLPMFEDRFDNIAPTLSA